MDALEVMEKFNEVHTEIELDMVDFAPGPFTTPIPVALSLLAVPRTIDLEAA